jgi:glucokinase
LDFGDTGEAEIGHIVVDPGGMLCGCGNRGCLETVCAGPGIPHLARRIASRADATWEQSRMLPRVLGDDATTSADIFAAWRDGDPLADAIVQQVARYLGYAASMIIQIVNPDVIVFGGGVGSSSERFVHTIQREVEGYVMPNLRGRCAFVQSALRENVVTQGAALLAVQTFRV